MIHSSGTPDPAGFVFRIDFDADGGKDAKWTLQAAKQCEDSGRGCTTSIVATVFILHKIFSFEWSPVLSQQVTFLLCVFTCASGCFVLGSRRMDDTDPCCEAPTERDDGAQVVGKRSCWSFAWPDPHGDSGHDQRGEGWSSIRQRGGAPPPIAVGQPYGHACVPVDGNGWQQLAGANENHLHCTL